MKNPVSRLLRAIVLPSVITDVERRHITRINRLALVFFALHVPVFVVIAACNGTGVRNAILFSLAVLAGPALATATFGNPRSIALVNGVTAMMMGALLVHFGQGPVQIEMHFYFFALIAMLAVYGNPLVIVVAAGTVALHHGLLWFLLPMSVFNYDAPLWVVGVHALFVVLEAIAIAFIARTFFEKVIGLERIVGLRTAELDRSNGDLRRVLDHVSQGLFTVDAAGTISREHSRALDEWFGELDAEDTLATYFARVSNGFGAEIQIGFEQFTDDVLPIELTIEQMPARLAVRGRDYRFEYAPLGSAPSSGMLVVVSDVTDELARARSGAEKDEIHQLFHRILADRSAVVGFVDETSRLMGELLAPETDKDLAAIKRALHTLKGNASLFGLTSVANASHALESGIAEEGRAPTPAELLSLSERWSSVRAAVQEIVGARTGRIEITLAEHAEIEKAALRGVAPRTLARMLHALRLEPTSRRLGLLAEQATRIAERLGKPGLVVEVQHNDLRVDPSRWAPFGSALVHAIRNGVDHGIESPEARALAGKSPAGRLVLRTVALAGRFEVQVEDDGGGVDWERLRERCISGGWPAASHEDLLRALATGGVSTAESAGEISGRGIGMSTLFAATHALGGHLQIESDDRSGTLLRASFPLDAMAPELAVRRSNRTLAAVAEAVG